jgi:starch synthase
MALTGHCPPLVPILYAGCDWTTVPSLWEPCGLTQMESMAYGTPVIARNTGGLSDSVISLHPNPHENPNFDMATGVLFNDYDKTGFKWGIEHGIYWTFYNLDEACIFINYKHVSCPESPYEENSPLSIMMKNCYNHVQKNLSWQNNDSAERYRALFGGAIYKHYF